MLLYGYVSHWDQVYEIRFHNQLRDRTVFNDQTKYLEMVIAGLTTHAIFKWEFEPNPL